MRGKYLVCTLTACVWLASAALTVQAEQVQKVSPNNSGFTIMPITNGGPNGALLDPTVPALGPGGAALDRGEAALVPEPSTIAMLFLGSGCAGAFTVLRRRRGA